MANMLNSSRLYLQVNWRIRLTESSIFLSDNAIIHGITMFDGALMLCGFDTHYFIHSTNIFMQ